MSPYEPCVDFDASQTPERRERREAYKRLPSTINAAWEVYSKGRQTMSDDSSERITDRMVYDNLETDGTTLDSFDTCCRFNSVRGTGSKLEQRENVSGWPSLATLIGDAVAAKLRE